MKHKTPFGNLESDPVLKTAFRGGRITIGLMCAALASYYSYKLLVDHCPTFVYQKKPNLCHSTLRFLVSSNLLPQLKPQIHSESALKVWVGGRGFRNPLGVAAGFDPFGQSSTGILRLGFGFCEIGSCANDAFPMWSSLKVNLKENYAEWTDARNAATLQATQAALYNRIEGIRRIKNARVGVNIGLSEETMETVPYLAEEDFMAGMEEFSNLGDYLVINLTSPKPTIGTEQFKEKDVLESVLKQVKEKREQELGIIAACEHELLDSNTKILEKSDIPLISRMYRRPQVVSHIPPLLFIKVPCDLTNEQISMIGMLAEKYGIDGIIVAGNSRSEKDKSVDILKKLYAMLKGRVALVSVGGIMDGKEAYKRIKAGATLVQVCSAVLLKGPYVGVQILEEILEELKKDGFNKIEEAIGKDCTNATE